MNFNARAGSVALFFSIAALALLAGCAESFHSLNVEAPPATPGATIRTQNILIRNVTDNRVFEDRPATADIPSLAEGKAATPSTEVVRAIGRVRDGFGKARGNVLLPEGKTVEALARQTVANTLQSLGYPIETDEGNVSANDIIVDVTIDKFWGWIDVQGGGGFVGSGAMYMSGAMETTLQLTGPLGKKESRRIAVQARHRLGIGVTPANWRKLYQMLLEEYAASAKKTLGDLPKP